MKLVTIENELTLQCLCGSIHQCSWVLFNSDTGRVINCSKHQCECGLGPTNFMKRPKLNTCVGCRHYPKLDQSWPSEKPTRYMVVCDCGENSHFWPTIEEAIADWNKVNAPDV